jgi:hypothetical protein
MDLARVQVSEAVAVSANPDDLPVQLAWAVRPGADYTGYPGPPLADPSVITALDALAPRFGTRPSFQAAILRQLAISDVTTLSRPDQLMVNDTGTGNQDTDAAGPMSDATALQNWDDAAAAGERIDPTNEFFPLMRALGLFDRHQDKEAIAEIRYAATLPRFDDYVADEADGQYRLSELAAGGSNAIAFVDAYQAPSLTYLMRMRLGLARLVTAAAIRQEQGGDASGGFAIRQALMRCGDRMRADSNTLTGVRAGWAMAETSWARPGGAFALGSDELITSFRDPVEMIHADHIARTYEAYLISSGRRSDTPGVERDLAALHQIRDVVLSDAPREPSAAALPMLISWLDNIAMIVTVIVIGVAAMLATCRDPRRRPASRADYRWLASRVALIALLLCLTWWTYGNGSIYRESVAALNGVQQTIRLPRPTSFGGFIPFVGLTPYIGLFPLFVTQIARRKAVAAATAPQVRPSRTLNLPALLLPITGALVVLSVLSTIAATNGARSAQLSILRTFHHEGPQLASQHHLPWPASDGE